MNPPFWRKHFSVIVIILVVIVFMVGFTISQSKTNPLVSSTRPANCVPLPWLSENSANRTPWADPRSLLETPGLIETIPTVAPHKVAHTYDLRPELSQGSKLMVFVFRCDGTEDLYLVDPQTYNTGHAIPLSAGDVISGVSSPSDMYYHGMPPTRTHPYPITPSVTPSGTSTPQSRS